MDYKQLKYSNFSNLIDLSSPVFASRLSLIVCIFLAIVGVVLGSIQESLAVLTNGLIAGTEIINSIFFFASVRNSIKVPDVFYNYGYGKYESLAILSSALLLILISVYAVFNALTEAFAPVHNVNYLVLISFSSFSFLAMQGMFRIQKKATVKHKMPVLEYDSEIWKFDSYVELGVILNLLIGLVLTKGSHQTIASIIDSSTAIILIGLALKIPLKHGKNALNQLLDRTLSESIQYDILAVIVENISKMCEYNGVHTRQAGKDIFIEIDVTMPYDLTLEEAFQTEQDIFVSLKEKYPTAVPRLYVTPCMRNCIYAGNNHCPVKKSLKKI